MEVAGGGDHTDHYLYRRNIGQRCNLRMDRIYSLSVEVAVALQADQFPGQVAKPLSKYPH